ncbi:hypothetical protein Pcinc_043009 [Petrolisthes cinctipes]|uniref:PWWP domain-containing protein n=1 Tax=Petrolisthes cinctipes TaxID=88211 RepID=A0AAE1EFG9_PETCI|nr:hypothetical protein Pcinc_043009 [Petrolisthes cinctipes]
MADTYKLGDLVWAKMKGFSPWPGKVIPARENVKKPSKKYCHFIYFFGSENYAWIESSQMKPYFQYKNRLMKANKTSTFKEAVECIEKYIVENNVKVPDIIEDLNESNHTEKSITPTTTPKEKKFKATPKRRSNSDTSSGGGSAKRIKHSDATRLKDASVESSPSSHNSKARVSALLNRPVHIERPDTPPLDIGSVTQTLKDKKIEPSGLKFGFLGLGIIGSGIVKNLLNSGHSVMVWNRSSEKVGA